MDKFNFLHELEIMIGTGEITLEENKETCIAQLQKMKEMVNQQLVMEIFNDITAYDTVYYAPEHSDWKTFLEWCNGYEDYAIVLHQNYTNEFLEELWQNSHISEEMTEKDIKKELVSQIEQLKMFSLSDEMGTEPPAPGEMQAAIGAIKARIIGLYNKLQSEQLKQLYNKQIQRRRNFSMAEKHKGFAYTEESEKYKVIYGDSRQEILDKLAGWNRTRAGNMKYVYCNIGTYDSEMNKYINYRKFDVATGRDISPLALKIPSVSKEEFERTIREFKENGAKFNSTYKKWYISPDNQNMPYFQKYLADEQAVAQKKAQEQNVDKAQPESQLSLEQRYTEALKPAGYSRQPDLPDEPEWQAFRNEQTGQSIKADGWELSGDKPETLQASDEAVREHDTMPNQQSYDFSEYAPELKAQFQKIAKVDIQEMDIAQEKLSLLQGLAEKDMELNGEVSDMTNYLLDLFHAEVSFIYQNGKPCVEYQREPAAQKESVQENREKEAPPAEKPAEQEKEAQPEKQQEEELSGYKEGDRIDVYRANMTVSPNDPQKALTYGISPVNGIIEEISCESADNLMYKVKTDNAFVTYVNQSELYTDQQANVLLRAKNDKLPPEKFDIVARHEFNGAQMEELRMAFKEGLSIEQVNRFADPAMESWQMDLCKYGVQHGLEMSEIQEVYGEQNKDWFQCRKEVNGLIAEKRQLRIKELERQGFTADEKMVKSMERLDHLTQHRNSLKDISDAFKEGIFKDSEAGNIVNYLGREFQQQEMRQQMLEAVVPEP